MSSSLYNLIRERAGSEMLYRAESMKMYDQASDFLSDNLTSEAFDLAVEFRKNYPSEAPVIPMVPINLVEVCAVRDKDLETLPWIYVHMLETLVSHDDLASKVLKEKLAASPAAEWRLPLPEDVSMADAFTHIFNEWVSQNGWVQSFDLWTSRQGEDDCAGFDICSSCRHDFGECICQQMACGCTRRAVCMDCTSGGGEGPAPSPSPSPSQKHYDYIGVICSKDDKND